MNGLETKGYGKIQIQMRFFVDRKIDDAWKGKCLQKSKTLFTAIFYCFIILKFSKTFKLLISENRKMNKFIQNAFKVLYMIVCEENCEYFRSIKWLLQLHLQKPPQIDVLMAIKRFSNITGKPICLLNIYIYYSVIFQLSIGVHNEVWCLHSRSCAFSKTACAFLLIRLDFAVTLLIVIKI